MFVCVCVATHTRLLTQAYHVTGICCLVSMVTRAHVTSWGSLRKSVNDALDYIHELIAVIIVLSLKKIEFQISQVLLKFTNSSTVIHFVCD